ncbi:transposase [Streptomyces sp. NPDC059851]|uniref:transposase n=1 Tax=Streptomyces sp. NPDC059851 TaxID=3346971 RepID=UPI003654AE4B
MGPHRAVAAGSDAEAQVIDAIAFKYRTGTPWMDLPERFGSWQGVHNRLRAWAADGTWAKVFTALLAQADAEGDNSTGSPPLARRRRHGSPATVLPARVTSARAESTAGSRSARSDPTAHLPSRGEHLRDLQVCRCFACSLPCA